MYSNPERLEPVEKIRKAQWTVENTRKTQEVIDDLCACAASLAVVTGSRQSPVLAAIRSGIERLVLMDPGAKIPDTVSD